MFEAILVRIESSRDRAGSSRKRNVTFSDLRIHRVSSVLLWRMFSNGSRTEHQTRKIILSTLKSETTLRTTI